MYDYESLSVCICAQLPQCLLFIFQCCFYFNNLYTIELVSHSCQEELGKKIKICIHIILIIIDDNNNRLFMHNGAPSDRTRSLDSMLELLQKRKDTLIFSLCLCHSLSLALGVSLSTCPFCDTSDSEIHFLLTITCPKYKMLRLRHTVRETYLPAKFYNCPSDSELRWLG